MLFLVVLLDAEDLAVVVLVLQNMRVLLALKPRILKIEQNRFTLGAALQNPLHLFALRQLPSIKKGVRGASLGVFLRIPLRMREVLEIVVNLHVGGQGGAVPLREVAGVLLIGFLRLVVHRL